MTRTVTEPSQGGDRACSRVPAAGHKLAKGGDVTIAVGAVGQQTTIDANHDHPTTQPRLRARARAGGAIRQRVSVTWLALCAVLARAPSRCALLEQRDLGDLRRFAARRKLGDPDQVVAVARGPPELIAIVSVVRPRSCRAARELAPSRAP